MALGRCITGSVSLVDSKESERGSLLRQSPLVVPDIHRVAWDNIAYSRWRNYFSMNIEQDLPKSNSIYPGCLVSLGPGTDDRVIMFDDLSKRTARTIRRLPLSSRTATGVAIEVFPNALVRVAERTWLVYFFPQLAVVEQSRLRRVSFSWKESHK
jgi:hypothetical protein